MNDKTIATDAGALGKIMRYLRPIMLIVVLAAIILLIKHVGTAKLVETFLSLDPLWMSVAVLFWGANVASAAYRYRSLSAPELGYFKVLEVILASFLLNYVAMVQGVGVGAKIGLMKGRQVSADRSLAGAGGEVVLDILFTGAITLMFVFFAGWNKSGAGRINPKAAIYIAIVSILCLAGFFVFSKISKFGSKLTLAFGVAFSRRRLLANILGTVGIWTMSAASIFCVMRAAGVAGINFFSAISAMGVGFIVGLISLVPGGLGVRDVTWAYVCSNMTGAPLAVTTAAAFSFRILGISTVAIALGIWNIFKKRGGENGK